MFFHMPVCLFDASIVEFGRVGLNRFARVFCGIGFPW